MGISVSVEYTVRPSHIAKKLLRYAKLIEPEIDARTKGVAYGIRDEAKTYDAAPRPSYRRTGNMSRRTTALRVNRMEWRVEMRAPYSVYVRGRADGTGQAWMHVRRWKKFETIITKHRKGYLADIREGLAEAKQKAGLE